MTSTIHCISDTHSKHRKIALPGGDILIHAGDCTSRGALQETIAFLEWFGDQDYAHLVLIPGNHDFIFEQNPTLMKKECEDRGIVLLNDSGIEIEGLKIWGSPITPWFFDWAFNRKRGADIKKHWDLIPEDTDILVTHGPPHMILDGVPRSGGPYEHVGCEDLYKRILQTNIKLHVFGHIHEGAGHRYLDNRTYINAASLDRKYQFRNHDYVRVITDKNEFLVQT